MKICLEKLTSSELIDAYSGIIKELKKREIIRTNNVVGDLGEYPAIQLYNQMPTLPKLSPAPVGTENIDAISRKGDRYSIKSTTSNVTGVFFGLEPLGSTRKDEKKFEYVIICKFDSDYRLLAIYEMDWDTFLKNKRWHSRMNAWYLALTKRVIDQCKEVSLWSELFYGRIK